MCMYFNTLPANQLSICIHACGLLVVTIMVTKRSCIPVAQISSLSGMTDRHSHAHSKIFIMVATTFPGA